jgi:hypothetical protein
MKGMPRLASSMATRVATPSFNTISRIAARGGDRSSARTASDADATGPKREEACVRHEVGEIQGHHRFILNDQDPAGHFR